jgi:hypothetical protein
MGDAFEAIIGAKKKEDPDALDKWFKTYYMPLLVHAAEICRYDGNLLHTGES